MILGADHLALSWDGGAGVPRRLERLGFERTFHERDVPNPKIKRPLMDTWTPSHELALYRSETLPIELINHGTSTTHQGPYEPMWVGAADDPTPWLLGDDADGEPTAELPPPQGSPSLVGVRLEAPDLQASVAFWTELGFELQGSGPASADLELDARFAGAPCRIELTSAENSGDRRSPKLDDEGFPVLALLCTDVEKHTDALDASGHEVTDVECLEVAGKAVSLAFVRGPSAAPVELVDVQARRDGGNGNGDHDDGP